MASGVHKSLAEIHKSAVEAHNSVAEDTKFDYLIPQTLRDINHYINECKVKEGLEPDSDEVLAVMTDDIMADYRTK